MEISGESVSEAQRRGSAMPIVTEDSRAAGELATHTAGTSEAAHEQGFHTSLTTAKW